jgi:predicted AlkP superfamily pyrophosphatase or phosphodiesterase
MRCRWLAALLALAVCSPVGSDVSRAQGPQGGAPAAAGADRPRLVVLLVVDQLRAADLDLFRRRWRGGFRRLLDEGAHFTRAEYPYLNTATCAGHATIGTGALPRTHGIILNRWWHRADRRSFNCMDDESSPHVSYGSRPSASGSSAKRILVPTLADELRRQHQGARVVSLSLKPRSAISLAGHGGDVVTWFDDAVARAFVTSTAFARQPIEAVQRFVARDAPEGALEQAWTLQEPPSSYRNDDLKTGERPKSGWTAIFPHALAGPGGADAQFYDRWQKSPLSDAYLERMAQAIRDDLRLGEGGATDYLAISFSALDLAGHEFGPDSRESEDLLLRLDVTIGALLQHLDTTVGPDRYVVALTSDHGVAPVPEQVQGGRIASEDLQQLVEQTLAARWGAPPGPGYVAWVGPGAVYFGDGVAERLREDGAALESVLAALRSVPGVERVLRTDTLPAAGQDAIVRAARAGYVPDRSGDLLIVARRHWIFELRSEGDATNHGTFHPYDRHVPVVLWGPGVRRGRYAGRATPADVAPTLAYMTGVSLPSAEGRVLLEALR